jgi:hypothetical protein
LVDTTQLENVGKIINENQSGRKSVELFSFISSLTNAFRLNNKQICLRTSAKIKQLSRTAKCDGSKMGGFDLE